MAALSHSDELWMSRCFDLARRGIGRVSPNPPVGAVLVHDGKILSEGHHPYFGGPHAEVEVFRNLPEEYRHLIPQATLYVSLEPCCIHAKTPPCTDLLVDQGVRDVRISIEDPNPEIAGKGIQTLRDANIQVKCGILENQGRELIRAFNINILHQRAHVILKWAQSKYGYIGEEKTRILISHPNTTHWSHGLRAGSDAILVGARTVMIDNPLLTVRDSPGNSPHRAVYDPNGKLNEQYRIFNHDGCRVFYFSHFDNPRLSGDHIEKILLDKTGHDILQMTRHLYLRKMGIVLVEGGRYLLNKCIEEDLWDEAWVIRSAHQLHAGITAPIVRGRLIRRMRSMSDEIVGIANERL